MANSNEAASPNDAVSAFTEGPAAVFDGRCGVDGDTHLRGWGNNKAILESPDKPGQNRPSA